MGQKPHYLTPILWNNFNFFGTYNKHPKTTAKISNSCLNMPTSFGCRSQTHPHTGISFCCVGMHVENGVSAVSLLAHRSPRKGLGVPPRIL